MRTTTTIAVIVIVTIVGIASFEIYQTYFRAPTCLSIAGGSIGRSQTSLTVFGPVTEYQIPGQNRDPAAVTAAADGSVWFAEWGVPGVAHLFPNNGTLVEYAWKGFPKPTPPFCGPQVAVSGIALWGGKVWAADQYGSAIVGVDPSDGSMVVVNTTSRLLPYWLAVGPDGNLWFTSESSPAALGRISQDMKLSVISLAGTGTDEPLQILFVNSSLAFVSAINLGSFKNQSCICDGRIYSFDPSRASSPLAMKRVGGDHHLVLPTSVAYSQGMIWAPQHGTSQVASYDFGTSSWTSYPTSRVQWTNTTLPLVTLANGEQVWFNEHYANKMALVDPAKGTLTEISVSNPPTTSSQGIQNDEFIAASNGRLWFTSLSGNYVGFVDSNFSPSFRVSFEGSNRATINAGDTMAITLSVTGTWTAPMMISASDSETYSSIPTLIHVSPTVSSIQVGTSSFSTDIGVAAERSVRPGNYTIAVTVTDGGVQQTAYFFLTVR